MIEWGVQMPLTGCNQIICPDWLVKHGVTIHIQTVQNDLKCTLQVWVPLSQHCYWSLDSKAKTSKHVRGVVCLIVFLHIQPQCSMCTQTRLCGQAASTCVSVRLTTWEKQNGIEWNLNACEIFVPSCKSCVLQDWALLHSCLRGLAWGSAPTRADSSPPLHRRGLQQLKSRRATTRLSREKNVDKIKHRGGCCSCDTEVFGLRSRYPSNSNVNAKKPELECGVQG